MDTREEQLCEVRKSLQGVVCRSIQKDLQELLEGYSFSVEESDPILIIYSKNSLVVGSVKPYVPRHFWESETGEVCIDRIDFYLLYSGYLHFEKSYSYDSTKQKIETGDLHKIATLIKEQGVLLDEAQKKEEEQIQRKKEEQIRNLKLREGHVEQAKLVLEEIGYTAHPNQKSTRIKIKRTRSAPPEWNLFTGEVSRPKKTKMPPPLVFHLNEKGVFGNPVASQPHIVITVDKLVEVVQILEKLQEVLDR